MGEIRRRFSALPVGKRRLRRLPQSGTRAAVIPRSASLSYFTQFAHSQNKKYFIQQSPSRLTKISIDTIDTHGAVLRSTL
jgi:hypothetical protein